MSQSSVASEATSKGVASCDDAFAQVLGPKCPGRVRGLGLGVSPSQVFGHTHGSYGVTLSANSTELGKFEEFKAEMNNKLNTIFTKIRRMDKKVDNPITCTTDGEQVYF